MQAQEIVMQTGIKIIDAIKETIEKTEVKK
jgi:hypothetical protein